MFFLRALCCSKLYFGVDATHVSKKPYNSAAASLNTDSKDPAAPPIPTPIRFSLHLLVVDFLASFRCDWCDSPRLLPL